LKLKTYQKGEDHKPPHTERSASHKEDIYNTYNQGNNVQNGYMILFLTKVPKTYDGERAASSTNVAGKSGSLPAEN
jgi:hypothetical protein